MAKTIVITGANRGIGFEAAKQLAAGGHEVVLTGRNQAKVEAAAATLDGNVIPHVLDVTDEGSIERFANFIKKKELAIDVLINNAGSVFDKKEEQDGPNPLTTRADALRKTLELNLVGAYLVIQHLFPCMTKNGRADIINISSGMGALKDMGTGWPAYRMSKAAMNAMTVWLSAELQGGNTKVNSLCPGWVRTELGGPNAHRTLEQGVQGILWIVNQEPDIHGKFIRDQRLIDF